MFKRIEAGRKSAISRFRDDTFGGITALTVVVFLTMVVSVGMAVDFMRHETHRAELQDALDRGVLAAAAFSQTIEAEDTVRAYLKSTNFVKDGYVLDVKLKKTTGSRTITAVANYEVDTFFLKIIGINTLDVAAKGVAVEGASKIEVSLVLDVSTSMAIEDVTFADGTTKTRLEVLRTSASSFIDSVFNSNNGGNINVSLVPFAGQVNVGATALNYFTTTTTSPDARCVELSEADFTVTTTPAKDSLTQMQHFNYSEYSNGTIAPDGVTNVEWGWCPAHSQRIEYFSDDPVTLKARINGLQTHEATGTPYGMKFGAMLLDPDASDLTAALVAGGEISGAQSNLPRPYTDTEVQKYIVIMSDGNTTGQSRLKAAHYGADDGDGVAEENEVAWWKTNLPSAHSNGWDVFEGINLSNTAGIDADIDTTEMSRAAARQAFRNTCEAARTNGVYIFAIGFDIDTDSDAEKDLKDCVKDNGGEYFDVEGTGLATAFSQIASTIQKLRLIN